MILHTTDFYFAELGQMYLGALYKAIFTSAYYGLFRVGELTKSPHIIKVSDVHLGVNKRKILFILRSSKMHTKGMQPQIVKIISNKKLNNSARTSTSDCLHKFCPYLLLKDYLEFRTSFWKIT